MRGSAMPDPEGTGDEALKEVMFDVEAAARQSSRPESNATDVFPGTCVSYFTKQHYTDTSSSMTLRNLPSRRASQQLISKTYSDSLHHFIPVQQNDYNMTSTTVYRGRGTTSRSFRRNFWGSNRGSSRGRALLMPPGEGTRLYRGRGRGHQQHSDMWQQPPEMRQQPSDRRPQPPDMRQQSPNMRQQPSDRRQQHADMRQQPSDRRQQHPDRWQQPPDRWQHHSPDAAQRSHMLYHPSDRRHQHLDSRHWAYERKHQPHDNCHRSPEMHQQPHDIQQQPPDVQQQSSDAHKLDVRQQAPDMSQNVQAMRQQSYDMCQKLPNVQHTSLTTAIQLEQPEYYPSDPESLGYYPHVPEGLRHCANAPVVHRPIVLKEEWPGHVTSVSKYCYREPHVRLRRLEEDPHRFVPTSNGRYHILHESPDRHNSMLSDSNSSFNKESKALIPGESDNVFVTIKTEDESYLCQESKECVSMNTNFLEASKESVLSILNTDEEGRENASGETTFIEDRMEPVLTIVKEEITIEEDPLEDELHRLMDSPIPSVTCSEELNELVEDSSVTLVTKPPTPPMSPHIEEPAEPQVNLPSKPPTPPLSPHIKVASKQVVDLPSTVSVTKPPTPPLSPLLVNSDSLLMTKICYRRKSAPELMSLPFKAKKRTRRYKSWPSVSIRDDNSEDSQEHADGSEDFKSSYHQKLKLTRSSNETWKIVNNSDSCEEVAASISYNGEIVNVCSVIQKSPVHITYSSVSNCAVNSDANEALCVEEQESKDTMNMNVINDSTEIEYIGEYRNIEGKPTVPYIECESNIVLCDVMSSPTFSAGIITAEEDGKQSCCQSEQIEMSTLVDRYTSLNHHVVKDFPDIPIVCDYGDAVHENQQNSGESNKRPLYENCKIVLVSSSSPCDYEMSKISNIHSVFPLDDHIAEPKDDYVSTEVSTVIVSQDDRNEHILQVNDCLEITTRQTESDVEVENINNVNHTSPSINALSEHNDGITVPDSVIKEVPLLNTVRPSIEENVSEVRSVKTSEDSKDMFGFKYATTDTGTDDEDDYVLKIDEDMENDESDQSQQALFQEKEPHLDQSDVLKEKDSVVVDEIIRKEQPNLHILQQLNEEPSKTNESVVTQHHLIEESNQDVLNGDKRSDSDEPPLDQEVLQQTDSGELKDEQSSLVELPSIQEEVIQITEVKDSKDEHNTFAEKLLPIEQPSTSEEAGQYKEEESKDARNTVVENASTKQSKHLRRHSKGTRTKRKRMSSTDECISPHAYQLRKRRRARGKYEEIEPSHFIHEVQQSEEEQFEDVQISSANQEPIGFACADSSPADKTISSASSTSYKCKQDSMPDHNMTNKNGNSQSMVELQHKVNEAVPNTRLTSKHDRQSKTQLEIKDNVRDTNSKKSNGRKKSETSSNSKHSTRKPRSSRRSFRHDNIKMFKVAAPSSHITLPWSYKSKTLSNGGSADTNQVLEGEVLHDDGASCEIKAKEGQKDATTSEIQSCDVQSDVVECTDISEDPDIIVVQHISNKRKVQVSVVLPTEKELNCKVLLSSSNALEDCPEPKDKTSTSNDKDSDNTNTDGSQRKKRGRKRKKKVDQEAPSVMEEVSQHIVTTHMQEKGRLAQEIPGFNWLEEKIRNGSVVNAVPPSKQIQFNSLDSLADESEPPEKQARLIKPSVLENDKPQSSVPEEIVVEDPPLAEKGDTDNSVAPTVVSETSVEKHDIAQHSIPQNSDKEKPKEADASPAKTPGNVRAPVIVSMSTRNKPIDPMLEQLASAGDLEVTISSASACSSANVAEPPSSFVSVQPVPIPRVSRLPNSENLWQYFGGAQQLAPPLPAAKVTASAALPSTSMPAPSVRPSSFLTQSSQDQPRSYQRREPNGEHHMLQRQLLSLPEQRWGWTAQWPNVAAGRVAASELKAEQQCRPPLPYQQAFSEQMATMARHAVTSFDTGLGLGLGHPPSPSQHHHLQQYEQYQHQLQQQQQLQRLTQQSQQQQQQRLTQQSQQQQQQQMQQQQQQLQQQQQQQQQPVQQQPHRRRHHQYRQPVAVAPPRLQQLTQGMLQYTPPYMISPYPTRPPLQRPAAQYPSIAYHHAPLYERVNGAHACVTNPAPPYYLDHRTELSNISPPLPQTDQDRELQTLTTLPRRVLSSVPRVNTRNPDVQRSHRHQPYPPHTVVHSTSDNTRLPSAEVQAPDQSMEELELDKLHTKQMLNIVENKGLEARTALKELVDGVKANTEEVIELREAIGSGRITASTLPASSPSSSCGQPTIGTTPMLHIGSRQITPSTDIGMPPPSSRSPASSAIYRRPSTSYIAPGTSSSSTSGRVNVKPLSQLSRPPEPIPAHSSFISTSSIRVSPNGSSVSSTSLEESPIDLSITKQKTPEKPRQTRESTNNIVKPSHSSPSIQTRHQEVNTVPDQENRSRLVSTNVPNEPSRLWHQLMSAPNSSNVPTTSSPLVSLASSRTGWARGQLLQDVSLPEPSVMQNIFENSHRRNSNESMVHHRQIVHPHIVEPGQTNHHPPLMSRLNSNHGLLHRHSVNYSDTLQSQQHREPHAPAKAGGVLQQQVSPMAGIIAPEGLNQANYPRERAVDNGRAVHHSRCNNCGEIARWQCSACHSAWYCSHPCQL